MGDDARQGLGPSRVIRPRDTMTFVGRAMLGFLERMAVSRMFRGGIVAVLFKIAYVVAQFGVGVLLARSLGAAGFGAYAFVMAVVQVLVIVGQWGIPALLVRRISVDLHNNRLDDIKRSLLNGLVLVTGTSLAAAIAFLAVRSIVGGADAGAGGQIIVMVATIALASVLGGALRGFGFVAASLLAEETLRPWLLLALIVAPLSIGQTMNFVTALTAHAAAAIGALLASLVLLAMVAPRRVWNVAMEWRVMSFAGLGLPFLFLAGAQTLSYQTDTIILGILTPGAPVGLYRTAFQIAEGVGIVLFAISTVIAPHLARAEADEPRLRAILIDAHRVGVALIVPALIAVLVSGDWILGSVFGAQYVPATRAMHILVIGKLFYATTAFVGLALSMTGRAWAAAVISVIVICLNVALALFLIPRFGIEGAAIADASSNFLVAVFGALYLRRLLGGHGVSAFAIKPKRR